MNMRKCRQHEILRLVNFTLCERIDEPSQVIRLLHQSITHTRQIRKVLTNVSQQALSNVNFSLDGPIQRTRRRLSRLFLAR
jgi:hypothetical protein